MGIGIINSFATAEGSKIRVRNFAQSFLDTHAPFEMLVCVSLSRLGSIIVLKGPSLSAMPPDNVRHCAKVLLHRSEKRNNFFVTTERGRCY